MNHGKLREMIEQATPQERRQFKAWINVYLDPMQKMRRSMSDAERRLELGDEEDAIARSIPIT